MELAIRWYARFTSSGSDGTYNALHKWYKPWFAWHARTFKTTTVEYGNFDITSTHLTSLASTPAVPLCHAGLPVLVVVGFFFRGISTTLLDASGVYLISLYFRYIPTRAYYHRHTKAIFWELQDMVPVRHFDIVLLDRFSRVYQHYPPDTRRVMCST